jgi:predicted ATPase
MINHVKHVEIENFKCFTSRTKIPISNLTVCTGMNSVGKSTLIQALLLMWQSHKNLNKKKVLLNTAALKLGSTKQITSGSMMLSANGTCFFYISAKDKLSLEFESCADSSIFERRFYYLNAERLGPRTYQQMLSHDFLHCGYNGEYTFNIIQKLALEEISEARCRNVSGKDIRDLNKQIEYWMSYIVNGIQVRFEENLNTQLANMEVSQTLLGTPFGSPNNFGFGISYVLPIITTGLVAENNSLFIAENPEAHLHPAGQSRIGEFLAQISCDNVQVIIETHSEHVINGIRKYALKHQVSPENICINYFSVNSKSSRPEINRLPLSKKMDILNWPDGFFDQESIDLKDLRMLREEIK